MSSAASGNAGTWDAAFLYHGVVFPSADAARHTNPRVYSRHGSVHF